MTDFKPEQCIPPRVLGDDYQLLLDREQVDWLAGVIAGLEASTPGLFQAGFLQHLRIKVYFLKAVRNIAESDPQHQESSQEVLGKLHDELVKWQAIKEKEHAKES